jgi:DNA-binding HxlR family transcriptional regulator
MSSYGEYCPIAVGAEFFADRWTPLVLREFFMGATRFNEIHRGMPRISRTLLSQRLRQLQARGIVDKRESGPGRPVEYRLTPAGEDLCQVVLALGHWASRWAVQDPTDEQLDAVWLVWHLHQFVDAGAIPDRRTTIEFDLRGPGGGRAWIVLDRGGSTACQTDPGYEVDVRVRGDNREAHRWFLGRTTLQEARRSGSMSIEGPAALVRGFPRWFAPNPFHGEITAMRGREADMLATT